MQNDIPLTAPALARSLAVRTVARAGAIALDESTDPRVVLTAARLILWAAGMAEPPDPDDGPLELRFLPEVPVVPED